MISNVNDVKTVNILAILNVLRSVSQATKNMVSQMTGLSVATCNNLLNELEAEGKIMACGTMTAPGAGRPAKAYRFNERFAFILCLYVFEEKGEESLSWSVCDLLGQRIAGGREIAPVDETYILQTVKRLLRENERICGVSFGFPGYYCDQQIMTCGIKKLIGCDILKDLEDVSGVSVYIENDVNAMCAGLCETSPVYEDLVLLAFYKGRGPGAGLVSGGKVLHGSSSYAGEIQDLVYPEPLDTLLLTHDGTIRACAAAAVAASVFINPTAICITGGALGEEDIPAVRELLAASIPQQHIPALRYLQDMEEYYFKGLCAKPLYDIRTGGNVHVQTGKHT